MSGADTTTSLAVVVDTNVIVAALLHPGRTPDQALEALLAGPHRLLVDARIEAEYREVLERRKFRAIDVDARERLLARLAARTVHIGTIPYEGTMTDGDDRMFVEVCLAGAADVLVSGNGRHFPKDLGFDVLSPTELLARLRDGARSSIPS